MVTISWLNPTQAWRNGRRAKHERALQGRVVTAYDEGKDSMHDDGIKRHYKTA